MVNKLRLSRDQLADFLSDNQQIRQFEKLFDVSSEASIALSDLLTEIINAKAAVNEDAKTQEITRLNAEIDSLRSDVEFLKSVIQGQEEPNKPYLDTKQKTFPNVDGRINWTSLGQFNARQNGLNLPIGATTIVRGYNNSGLTLPAGRAVRLAGVVSNSPGFNIAGCETIFDCIGLTMTSSNTGDQLFVINFGLLENVDASGVPYGEVWNPGDLIYVGIGSFLTKNLPAKPYQQVPIAEVIDSTTLFVFPNRDVTALDVSDFNINSPLSGDLLIYNATNFMWDNKRLTQNAGGIIVTNLPGEIRLSLSNITNDQASKIISSSVSLSDGAGASVGTITNAPSAGNPTKWIPVNDNGTTRHIPAW